MLAQTPRLLTDGHDSVAGQRLGVLQEGDSDSEEVVKPQTIGLATAKCEMTLRKGKWRLGIVQGGIWTQWLHWTTSKGSSRFSFICCCNEFEANAAFKETLLATGGSTPPAYEAYSADMAGSNAEASCMSDAEGEEAWAVYCFSGGGKSKNAPTISSIASTTG